MESKPDNQDVPSWESDCHGGSRMAGTAPAPPRRGINEVLNEGGGVEFQDRLMLRGQFLKERQTEHAASN